MTKNKTQSLSGEALLDRMYSLIQENPGIRPSELNRRLEIEHSSRLRDKLIQKGLIRKQKEGAAVRYYST